MEQFRASMLGEGKLRSLADYPNSKDVFPGIELKGGVCHFLWDKAWNGQCAVATTRGEITTASLRSLDEFDVFIRDPRSVEILAKVLAHGEPSVADLLTNREPFKFESNFDGFHEVERPGDVPIYHIRAGKRGVGFIAREEVTKNSHLIDSWKVLVAKGYGAGETTPHQILGMPQLAPAPSVCTGSFMFFFLDTEEATRSLQAYLATRFFRFLVSLRKITQDAFRSVYIWVPQQPWNHRWTDADLYAKYGITDEEIAYIESVIRPMELADVED